MEKFNELSLEELQQEEISDLVKKQVESGELSEDFWGYLLSQIEQNPAIQSEIAPQIKEIRKAKADLDELWKELWIW